MQKRHLDFRRWLRNRQTKRQEKLLEQQKQIAHRLYLLRKNRGYAGDADKDWQTAGNLIANPARLRLFHLSQHTRQCWRWVIDKSESSTAEYALDTAVRDLKHLAIFDLLQLVANITIVISLASFLSGGEQQRHNAEVYEAWQIITNAHNQPGSGGRRRALEFLNATPGTPGRRRWYGAVWPQERLAGIDLSNAYLLGVRLPYANLRNANFSNTTLYAANFHGAALEEADLRNAEMSAIGTPQTTRERFYSWLKREDPWNDRYKLRVVDFSKAKLHQTNFQGANLRDADLREAELRFSDLTDASLEGATLRSAKLRFTTLVSTSFHDADLSDVLIDGVSAEKVAFSGANMQESRLTESVFLESYLNNADLTGALLVDSVFENVNFEGAKLSEAILFESDLSKAENVGQDHFYGSQQAIVCRTKLPPSIKVDTERDCDQLPQILHSRYPQYFKDLNDAEIYVEEGPD